MGTIAEKLSYLDNTREKILTNINALGGELTEENTFRSYADELDNIWEDQTHTTGEGTSITLQNTKKGNMKIGFKAVEITQETTTGKNILNINDTNKLVASSGTDVTKSGNNVSITISSTTGFVLYSLGAINDYKGQTLTFSLKANTNNIFKDCRFINCDSTGGNRINLGNTLGTGNTSFSYSVPNETFTQDYLAMRLYVSGEENTTYLLENPMVEISASATPYEPYTGGEAKPNPSYTSEVHTIKGDNVITTINENLFNIKGDVGYRYNGTHATTANTVSGNDLTSVINSNSSQTYGQKIYVGTGTTITGTVKLKSVEYDTTPSSSDAVATIRLYNDNILTGRANINFTYDEVGTTKTISFTATTDYIYFCFGRSTYTTSATFTDIALQRGTTATYIPHEETSYPISLPAENLFDKSSAIWVSKTIGSSTRYGYKLPSTTKDFYISKSGSGSGSFSVYEDVSGTLTNNKSVTDEPKLITYTGNDYYLMNLSTTNETTAQNDFANYEFMMSYYPTHYYPYGTTPIEVCKIGAYEDKLFKATDGDPVYDTLDIGTKSTLTTNKWYIEKNVGKDKITGVSSVGTTSYGINYATCTPLPTTPVNQSTIYCENYLSTTGANTNNRIRMVNSQIRIYDNRFTSTSIAEEYTNGLSYYYPLSAPSYILLNDTLQTQLESAWRGVSYESETNLLQTNNDLPFNLNAKALLDTNTVITNLEAEVEALS